MAATLVSVSVLAPAVSQGQDVSPGDKLYGPVKEIAAQLTSAQRQNMLSVLNMIDAREKKLLNALDEELIQTPQKDKSMRGQIGLKMAQTQNQIANIILAKAVVEGREPQMRPEQLRQTYEIIMSLRRPIWVLCDGRPYYDKSKDTYEWHEDVLPFLDRHKNVLGSVGSLAAYERTAEGERILTPIGTAFAVHERLLVTNQHVLRPDEGKGAELIYFDGTSWRFYKDTLVKFNPGNEYDQCRPRADDREIPVVGIVAVGGDRKKNPSEDWALLLVDERYPLKPLKPDSSGSKTQGRVAVVGYPGEPELPQSALKALFGTPDDEMPFNVKRVSPGGLLNIRQYEGVISYDSNTSGGNSGSPVFRMSNGAYVGLHFGGVHFANQSRNMAIHASILEAAVARAVVSLPASQSGGSGAAAR